MNIKACAIYSYNYHLNTSNIITDQHTVSDQDNSEIVTKQCMNDIPNDIKDCIYYDKVIKSEDIYKHYYDIEACMSHCYIDKLCIVGEVGSENYCKLFKGELPIEYTFSEGSSSFEKQCMYRESTTTTTSIPYPNKCVTEGKKATGGELNKKTQLKLVLSYV